MKLFDFDPAAYRDTYATQGYVHVRSGVSAEFLDHLIDSCGHRSSDDVLHGTGIFGAKQQHLYEPPADLDLVGELRDLTTRMCGLDGRRFTLAERHIKAYAADADPAPVAHKDRLASQVSIGISIEVPEGSHLVLYPDVHRDVNPFLTTEFRASLAPERQPDRVLDGVGGIEIHDQPGDVVAFPGSSVWHLRRRCAGTINLYLKCNDFDSDPLGEDPSTDDRRRRTEQLLASGRPDAVAGSIPVWSRRLEWVGHLHGRDHVVRAFAKPWDSAPIELTDAQLGVLDAIERGAAPGPSGDDVLALARRGLVDLIAPA